MTLQSLPLPIAGRGVAGGLRFAAQSPEPGHLWIRYAPRGWEGPESPWLDLAAGRLGRNGRVTPGSAGSTASAGPPASDPERPGGPIAADSLFGAAAAEDRGRPRPRSHSGRSDLAPPLLLDDLLYLPPVPAVRAAERDALAAAALGGGAPVLIQLLLGDGSPPPAATLVSSAGAVVVLDLLPALLGGEVDRLATAPAWAAAAVFPLLPGLTDDPALWERGCERLARAGVGCVQALVPALEAGDRRRLAQGAGDAGKVFDALFHQPAPGERDFARVAHRFGLRPFLPRPLPLPPWPRADNRRLAGLLALAGDLWLRVGRRPVEQAQALFRAARWLDATGYDVDALSREGNLAVVNALDPLSRRAIVDAVGGGEPALLAELMAEYLG